MESQKVFTAGIVLLFSLPLLVFFMKGYVDTYFQERMNKGHNHAYSSALWGGIFLMVVSVFIAKDLWEVIAYVLMYAGTGWIYFDPIHNRFTNKPTWYINPNGDSAIDVKLGWLKRKLAGRLGIGWVVQGLGLVTYFEYQKKFGLDEDVVGIYIGVAFAIIWLLLMLTHFKVYQKYIYNKSPKKGRTS